MDAADGLASLTSAEVFHGNMREILPTWEADSIDAVVCDPPYDLLSASRGGSLRTSKDPANNPFSRHDRGTPTAGGGFMGEKWDSTGVAFDPVTWQAVFRVLKPGGFVIAFGGTRTFHRMMCAIEDAGFEIRDCIGDLGLLGWVYGSGMPKSLDVSKAMDKAAGAKREVAGYDATRARPNRKYRAGALGAIGGSGTGNVSDRTDNGATRTLPATEAARQWEGWGTALKPAWEPIVLARKPLDKANVAANVREYGTGALNIDGCRIAFSGETDEAESKEKNRHADFGSRARQNNVLGDMSQHTRADDGKYDAPGRWPANVVLCHTDECEMIGMRTIKGDERGEPGGQRPGGFFDIGSEPGDGKPNGRVYGAADVPVWECVEACPVRLLDEQNGEHPGCKIPSGATGESIYRPDQGEYQRQGPIYPDTGGPSRFFYTAKASRSERDERVRTPEQPLIWSSGTQNPGSFQSPNTHRAARNYHPTVKPLDLMRWLCRMVTPPGGKVLDPFSGSGSTLVAALLEGFDAVGIDLKEDYVAIARQRINGVQIGGLL